MIKTLNKLRTLLSRIEKCLKCYAEKFKDYSEEDRVRIRHWYNKNPWFFPPYNGVKGFFGTGEVMFVCQRPSTQIGIFPRGQSSLFYKLLKEYGFGNAHLTDLIKCRGLVREGIEGQLDNCLPHLMAEIEALQPRLIVAVGDKAFDILQELGLSMRIEKITHYGYRKITEERLRRDLERIKELSK